MPAIETTLLPAEIIIYILLFLPYDSDIDGFVRAMRRAYPSVVAAADAEKCIRRKRLLLVADQWVAAAHGGLALSGSAAIPSLAESGRFSDVDIFQLNAALKLEESMPEILENEYPVSTEFVCHELYPSEFIVDTYVVPFLGNIQFISFRQPCNNVFCTDNECRGTVVNYTLEKLFDRFDVPHAMVAYTVPRQRVTHPLCGTSIKYRCNALPDLKDLEKGCSKWNESKIAASLRRAFKYTHKYKFELDTAELHAIVKAANMALCVTCGRCDFEFWMRRHKCSGTPVFYCA